MSIKMDQHLSSLTRSAVDFKRAANLLYALSHAHQANMSTAGVFLLLGIKSRSIIANRKEWLCALEIKRQVHARRVRMLNHIGQRFLANPKQLLLDVCFKS